MSTLEQQKISAWHSLGPVESDLGQGTAALGGLHRIGQNYKPINEGSILKKKEKKLPGKVVHNSPTLLPEYDVSAWHTVGPKKSKLAAGEVEAGSLHRIGKNYKPNTDFGVPRKPKNKSRNSQPMEKTSQYEVGSGQLHRQGKNFKPEYEEQSRHREAQKYRTPNGNTNLQTTKGMQFSRYDSSDEYRKIRGIIDEFAELVLEDTERSCTLFNCSSDVNGIEYWTDPTEDSDSQEDSTTITEEYIAYNTDKALEEPTEPTSPEVISERVDEAMVLPQITNQGEIIMLLDIEIHDGGVKTIVLHEFDDPQEVADDFCETWSIPGNNVATRLAKLIIMQKEQILESQ